MYECSQELGDRWLESATRHRRSTFPSAWGAALTVGALLLTACDAPPPAREGPQTRPAERSSAQAEPGTDRAATRDASQSDTPFTTQPITTQPAATQPATTQPDQAPTEPPPKYVTILKQFDAERPAELTARIERGNRLVIDTRNVERLEIHRDELDFAPQRSIALMLDGQPFEWLPRSTVNRFERSANGVWAPLP